MALYLTFMNYLLLRIYCYRVIFNIKTLEASRKSCQSNTLPSTMCAKGYSACNKISNRHWRSRQLFWVFIHIVLLLLTLYCWHNIAILHIRKLRNQRLKNLNIIHPGRGWTLKRANYTILASPLDAVIKNPYSRAILGWARAYLVCYSRSESITERSQGRNSR